MHHGMRSVHRDVRGSSATGCVPIVPSWDLPMAFSTWWNTHFQSQCAEDMYLFIYSFIHYLCSHYRLPDIQCPQKFHAFAYQPYRLHVVESQKSDICTSSRKHVANDVRLHMCQNMSLTTSAILISNNTRATWVVATNDPGDIGKHGRSETGPRQLSVELRQTAVKPVTVRLGTWSGSIWQLPNWWQWGWSLTAAKSHVLAAERMLYCCHVYY